MFIVRRAVIDIGHKSVRYHFRTYCNSAKQFKKPNESTVSKENVPNGNNEKKQNNDHETDDEANSSQHEERTNDSRLSDKDLMIRGQFGRMSEKNRDSFLSMVNVFVERDKHRRHHVEFIYAALKHMKEFGVERDLEVYRAILDIMPKGKMISTNMFQSEFMHYPKHQDCGIFLLDQMEYNGLWTHFTHLSSLLIIWFFFQFCSCDA